VSEGVAGSGCGGSCRSTGDVFGRMLVIKEDLFQDNPE
jgi:hypothetical protein